MSKNTEGPDYKDVLQRVRAWADTQEKGFSIWHPRWDLAAETPGAYDPSRALSDAYIKQVLRAINSMVKTGYLVKRGERQDAMYYTVPVWTAQQCREARAHADRIAELERWRQIKMRLATLRFTNISDSQTTVRLDADNWERLLDRLEKTEES